VEASAAVLPMTICVRLCGMSVPQGCMSLRDAAIYEYFWRCSTFKGLSC
jgi:hypothetical protein